MRFLFKAIETNLFINKPKFFNINKVFIII